MNKYHAFGRFNRIAKKPDIDKVVRKVTDLRERGEFINYLKNAVVENGQIPNSIRDACAAGAIILSDEEKRAISEAEAARKKMLERIDEKIYRLEKENEMAWENFMRDIPDDEVTRAVKSALDDRPPPTRERFMQYVAALESNRESGGQIWRNYIEGYGIERQDLDVALRAQHRHENTEYDDLLRKGVPREMSREIMQEKRRAMRNSNSRIRVIGRIEEILSEDDWSRVKRAVVPEIGCGHYLFIESKNDTVAAIVETTDIDGNRLFIMKNEATLQSNFTPALKIMTETVENGEVPDDALVRGLKEELGLEDNDVDKIIYLGSINGTFLEAHNYHIYYVVAPYYNKEVYESAAKGDGSLGEERSGIVIVSHEDFVQSKDFLSWVAYGMLQHAEFRGDIVPNETR